MLLQENSTTLRRPCEVVQIPSGERMTLPAGTPVRITQSLGGMYTVVTEDGYMVRIDGKDADALGKEATAATQAETPAAATAEELEKQVWEQLKTIYDPEIPVNVVELGLVYVCQVTPVEGGFAVTVQMSLTAPGCGMGDVLRLDAQSKIRKLAGVKDVQVEIVMDPPWDRSRMSEAAKLQLGMFDY